MPDTPVVSGNELTSNPGNAALGYSSGISYGNNPAIENPLSGIDSTLAIIQKQDYQDRTQRHLEQRQDLEGMSQMLANTKGSLFNMKDDQGNNISFTPLSEDKKILDTQADKIRRLVLNNPETYKSIPEYFQYRRELDFLNRHAGLRAAFATHQNQLASTEPDQTERQGILKNANEQISSSLTDYKMPAPYLQGPKFTDELANPKLWQDPKNLQQFGTSIEDRNGTSFEVKKAGIPTNELLKPLTDVSNTGLNNAKAAQALWLRRPEALDPNYIQAMNAKIAENAAARGIPPVFGAQVTPDGKVVYSNDPRQLLAAHNLYSYGALRTEEKPTDAPTKVQDSKARIAKMQADTDQAWARIKLQKDKQEQDKDKEKYHATNAALEVARTFEKYRNATAKSVDQQSVPELIAEIRTFNIDPNNTTILRLPSADQNIKEIAGAKKYNSAGVGQNDYETPEEAYYLKSKNGIEDDKIATKIPVRTKVKVPGGGEEIKMSYKWNLTAVPEAVSNKINYINRNGKTTPQTSQALDDAINTVREALGIKKKEQPQESEQVPAGYRKVRFKRADGTTGEGFQDLQTGKIKVYGG